MRRNVTNGLGILAVVWLSFGAKCEGAGKGTPAPGGARSADDGTSSDGTSVLNGDTVRQTSRDGEEPTGESSVGGSTSTDDTMGEVGVDRGEPIGGSTGAYCPTSPTLGCRSSEDACALERSTEYPCGEPSPSGADVDVYADPEGEAWFSSILGRTSDGCPPYYAFVLEQGMSSPEETPNHRFSYFQLGGGCGGTSSPAEILDVAVGDPCTGPVQVGCSNNRDAGCGELGASLGRGEVGVYRHSEANPQSPSYWFLFNGTGCHMKVDLTVTNSVSQESYSETVDVGTWALQLGPDYEYYNGEQPMEYSIDNVRVFSPCDEGQCPAGFVCSDACMPE